MKPLSINVFNLKLKLSYSKIKYDTSLCSQEMLKVCNIFQIFIEPRRIFLMFSVSDRKTIENKYKKDAFLL